MSWFISKSPFGRDEDPVKHVVELLSREADEAGTSLTALEKEILAQDNLESMTDDLRHRAKGLIARIYEAEPWAEFEGDPKSFANSLEWVRDSRYPNVVALAEEVRCEIAGLTPPLQGWKRVKDAVQLVGCGLLVVLLMFAIVITAGFLLGWK